jgi:hypothetical protein
MRKPRMCDFGKESTQFADVAHTSTTHIANPEVELGLIMRVSN